MKYSSSRFYKKLIVMILSFFLCAWFFYWISGSQLRYETIIDKQEEITGSIGELSEGSTATQELLFNFDQVTALAFKFADYGRNLSGKLDIILHNETDNITYPSITVDVSQIKEGDWFLIDIPYMSSDLAGKKGNIEFIGHSPTGEAPTIFYAENGKGTIRVNEKTLSGQLCMIITGRHYYRLAEYYWLIITIGAAALAAGIIYIEFCRKHGRKNSILQLEIIWERYRFLIKQLVSRDFKTKYKRSVLGYLWSFLNPLLTSLVQYMVFSTLFKSDIKNFPIYLLTGTIFFGFFSEAVSQGLSAIVGNSSLITKVYVPKWIYPVTKVCASATNFIISLIPLYIVALITGCRPNFALILLIFDIICLLLFCIGLAMALSACNVFFRDIQYLWGVISMVWMYGTPLFYPETIIPEAYRSILKLNPLYHYVNFARTCIIDGVAPSLNTFAFCLGAAVISLVIGCIIFKKTQNKFALYI